MKDMENLLKVAGPVRARRRSGVWMVNCVANALLGVVVVLGLWFVVGFIARVIWACLATGWQVIP